MNVTQVYEVTAETTIKQYLKLAARSYLAEERRARARARRPTSLPSQPVPNNICTITIHLLTII